MATLLCEILVKDANKEIIAPETWSPILQEAAKVGDIKVVPYDIDIGYEFWTYSESKTPRSHIEEADKSQWMS